jgi:DNA polymerase III alpha subunit
MAARSRGGVVPPIRDFTEEEKFSRELEILGLSARRHVLSYLAPPRAFDSRALEASAGKRVRLLGVMATSRIAETSRSEPMEFVTMEDEHGLFEVVLFPPVFRRCRAYIGTLGPYEVIGRVESRYDVTAITADSVRPYAGGVSKGERERGREGEKSFLDLSEVHPGSG